MLDLNGNPVNGFAITEVAHQTGHSGPPPDSIGGKINFFDINKGDTPTVTAALPTFTYQNAAHSDVTAGLNALQLADIAAVKVALQLVPDPGNKNTGSVTWTYTVPDNAFDFLAAGEKLTLTYTAIVNNNFPGNPETTPLTFTIEITGTNDDPVITTGPQTIDFAAGKTTPGGNLPPSTPTAGTLAFNDVDLTDTHTVATALTKATLSGSATVNTLAAFKAAFPGPEAAFETALSALVATDSTGTGSGVINWKLADLPVYLADFIPAGQTLTLTYTVTVTDSQGAISTQDVIVHITGTDTPAVVWIATTTPGSPPGGLWSDAKNWETGNVPTAADDAIIITNQLIGLTPSYPVTIDAPAVAKTVTLNDFSNLANAHPQLINLSTLTIGGAFDISVDSIVDNSGTITVGGAMEIADHSVLDNSGTLHLSQGGDFKDQSSITNEATGTIDVAGGTLNVLVDIANSGQITVDPGAKLTLDHATITGGIVTDNGEIDLTGTGVIKNGTLNNTGRSRSAAAAMRSTMRPIINNGGIEVLGLGALTLDQLTTVANGGGSITVDATGKLTLNNATVTGGPVTDSGEIDLTGTAVLKSGTLGNSGLIKVGGSGNALTLDRHQHPVTGRRASPDQRHGRQWRRLDHVDATGR